MGDSINITATPTTTTTITSTPAADAFSAAAIFDEVGGSGAATTATPTTTTTATSTTTSAAAADAFPAPAFLNQGEVAKYAAKAAESPWSSSANTELYHAIGVYTLLVQHAWVEAINAPDGEVVANPALVGIWMAQLRHLKLWVEEWKALEEQGFGTAEDTARLRWAAERAYLWHGELRCTLLTMHELYADWRHLLAVVAEEVVQEKEEEKEEEKEVEAAASGGDVLALLRQLCPTATINGVRSGATSGASTPLSTTQSVAAGPFAGPPASRNRRRRRQNKGGAATGGGPLHGGATRAYGVGGVGGGSNGQHRLSNSSVQ